ncbi:MAG: OmpH family outer membrane protein [Flavobacteriales bacterium]|nr:OmpH family outer membrane protein [Flavobacteriales bacterium]
MYKIVVIFISMFLGSISYSLSQSNMIIGFANFSEIKQLLPEHDSLEKEVQAYSVKYELELVDMAAIVHRKSEEIDLAKDEVRINVLKAEHQVLTAMLKEQRELANEELAFIRKAVFSEVSNKVEKARSKLKKEHQLDYFYDSSKRTIPTLLNAVDLTEELKKALGLQ